MMPAVKSNRVMNEDEQRRKAKREEETTRYWTKGMRNYKVCFSLISFCWNALLPRMLEVCPIMLRI